MPRQMKTGIAGLDQILDGGFLYHNSILLKGPPGSGKTTLGIQIVYNGAVQFGEPGIIVLFEQFPQQLYRDVSSYNWDIEALAKDKKLAILFAEPDEVVAHERVSDSPLLSRIQDAAIETGAKRILIDSLSHFVNITKVRMDSRDLLLRFINSLKSIGLTPMLTAEKENVEGWIGFDEYLTDCVVLLSSEASKDKTFPIRQLEIRKTRGHNHLRGKHPYTIGKTGIEIFPHRLPEPSKEKPTATGGLEHVPSGIIGFDDLLGGGYTRGTATVVAGLPGTYKTTLGLLFLLDGAKSNEPGMHLTFNESPDFLTRVMGQKGMDLATHVASEKIKIWQFFPKSFYVDELLYRLEEEFASGRTRRLVLDGTNELERSIENPDTYKDYIASLLALLARYNVTSVFLQKLDQLTGSAPLTNIRYSEMFDGIVYVAPVEIESAVHKMISVLKMRGSDFSSDLRELRCEKGGLCVTDKFVGMSGILAGNPQGQYKKTVEEVFQPVYFIRDFIELFTTPDLDPDQRRQMADSLKTETNKLVERLEDYFDIGK